MRILLLGGTGAMGVHLAMLLSKQGNVTCPKIALHSNNYKKCTSYD